MASTSTNIKRKHKTLTLSEKMEILNRLENGESICKLAKEYDVGRATVHDIKKKKSKIEECVNTMERGPEKRKTLKVGYCPKMETALYKWFQRQRAENKTITGEVLKTKAIELYKKITKKDNFRASPGWIDKFKKRFGIRLIQTPAEKISSNESAVHSFDKMLQAKIDQMGLSPDQVYKVNESELCWKMLPIKTVVTSQEYAAPERVTFMACANASGNHRFNLIVVGKSLSPRAFENVNLPVLYSDQASWVTGQVFTRWFREEFVPGVRIYMRKSNLSEKALLLLDHVPGHLSAEDLKSSDGMIQTMVLPSASTSLMQPLDSIIKMIKLRYRKNLLVDMITRAGNIPQCLEEINIKNFVFSLAHSWNSIPASKIRSSWKNLWPSIPVSVEENREEEDLPISTWMEIFADKNMEIKEEELTAWFQGSVEEIELTIKEEICGETSEVKEEKQITVWEPSIEVEEALKCFTKCVIWAEENGVSTQEVMVLSNLRDKVFKEKWAKNKRS